MPDNATLEIRLETEDAAVGMPSKGRTDPRHTSKPLNRPALRQHPRTGRPRLRALSASEAVRQVAPKDRIVDENVDWTNFWRQFTLEVT